MFKLGVLAITLGIGYMARLLLGGKEKQKSAIDDSVVEPSVRGTIIPLTLGINRLAPVIGYVGDTITKKTKSSSGGKGGGGGGSTTVTTYLQSALHILTIGEGAELTRITEGGKTIFDTVITPSSHPSGSQLTSSEDSVFRIYWGEDGQSVDSGLAALTGVNTRYPFMMYIVWNRKKLGEGKVWPTIEYEVFVKTQQDTLFGKNPIINESINPFSLSCDITDLDRIFVDSDLGGYYTRESVIETTNAGGANVEVGYQVTGTIDAIEYTALITGVSESGGTYTFRTQSPIPSAWYSRSGTLSFKAGVSKGLNPAAILYQLLFETYPHGLGVDVADYNLTDLEAIFDYFALEATLFPASLLIKSNKSIRDGIGMVMQDCGVAISWDSETSQYRFIRMATTDTPTTINTEFFDVGDRATLKSGYAVLDPALRTYKFIDSNRKFKDSTIITSDDGRSKYTGMPNSKKVSMEIVRDLLTASFVSAYRDRENFVRSKFSTKLSKEKAGFLVGGLFNFEGVTGNFRLSSKTIVPDNSMVKTIFIEDAYSEVTLFVVKKFSGLFPGDSSGAREDVLVRLQEISRFTNPDEDGVFVVRVRQNIQIQGMFPYLSDNDVTYNQFDLQNQYAVGGKLLDEISDVGPAIDNSSPEFSISGPDAADVLDLTASDDEARWRSGEQLCIIGSELFFLRGISPTATPGEYSLEGLIRARWGSVRGTHGVGDNFIIFSAADIEILKATFLIAGTDVFAKTVPFTTVDTMDISEITAEMITYQGGGFRPLTPINLNTEDLTGGFEAGTDTTFVWGYRNTVGGAGAGLGFSDAPYNNPLPEGYFRLEFLTTGDTIVRTVDLLAVPTYEYSNADRVSDFGGSDFKVKVYNILNSLESDFDILEVEVV